MISNIKKNQAKVNELILSLAHHLKKNAGPLIGLTKSSLGLEPNQPIP
jgi:hypothetical protein